MAQKPVAPWDRRLVLRVLTLVLCNQSLSGLLKVKMAEHTQIVVLNENVTISCKILGSQHLDTRIMGITWFWKSKKSSEEVRLFQLYADHKDVRRHGAKVSLQKLVEGDASLLLPLVQLKDAGEYRCEVVVTPEKAQGWVLLEVVAFPAGCLLPEMAVVENNEEQTLVCESRGFYPESVNITWEKLTEKDSHALDISEGVISGPTIKNKDGTFNVTSSLKLKPSLEDNGSIYQCVVWHTVLPTPKRFNFTLIVNKHKKKDILVPVIAGIGALIVFILLVIYLNKKGIDSMGEDCPIFSLAVDDRFETLERYPDTAMWETEVNHY